MRRKRKGKWERLLERYVRFMEFRHGMKLEFLVYRTKIERWGLRWNRSGFRYDAYVRISGAITIPPYIASCSGSRFADSKTDSGRNSGS